MNNIEKQWKERIHDIYLVCPKCGRCFGSTIYVDKNHQKVFKPCPDCGTMMRDLNLEEKEYMLKRM